METAMAKDGAYLGSGAGVILFVLFGLMPSCLMGGAAGVTIAGILFGLPLDPGILTRMIILASMLIGVILCCAVSVMASASVGWLMGAAADAVLHDGLRSMKRRQKAKKKRL